MLRLLTIFLLCVSVLFSCSDKKEWNYAIIPAPDSITPYMSGQVISSFVFPSDTGIYGYALETIKDLNVLDVNYEVGSGSNIIIVLDDEHFNGSEFSIDVQKDNINIKAGNINAVKTAISRLIQLQLLNDGVIPSLTMMDSATFSYRGMHLDVGRHFFPVDDIKKYIDYLFIYGFNNFHWHLTEDQGWRIEIKKYPRLQKVAAFRNETLIGHYNDQPHQYDGTRYGGYYSHEEIKDIVEYAMNKGINVIPEIELPGHSLAALAAYPELGCEDKEYEVGTKWGIYDDIYCPTETTFEFLQDVLDEVMELFPSRYIHIGGDEAPKRAWKESQFCQDLIREEGLVDEHGLQSYFIKRIESYLNSKGRQIIGWDEILEGGLAPNATVMSWRGTSGGIEAADMGHDVIMTPTSHCYFDYYQSDHPDEPLAIGGFLPLKKVYHFDPVPEQLNEEGRKKIIGAQGNVWTEYIKNFKGVEYMALVRMMALSEVLWVEERDKDYEGFIQSLTGHIINWNERGVNIANHLYDISPQLLTENINGTRIIMKEVPGDATIELKGPGHDTWKNMDGNEMMINETGEYLLRAVSEEFKGRPYKVSYEHHLGPLSNIVLTSPPAERYSGNGPYSLINGVKGSDEKYGDKEWLGFEGTDFESEIQLPKVEKISNITLRFFNGEGQWIYLPSNVQVFSSLDGENYQLVGEKEKIASDDKVANTHFSFEELSANYIKVVAKNYGIIPEGKQGAGHRSWLFVDEITID